MSEELKESGGRPLDASGAAVKESGTNQVSEQHSDAAVSTPGRNAEDKVSYDSYRKALDELKGWKNRALKYEGKATTLEQNDLQRQGKQDEVIQSLRDQNSTLQKQLAETNERYAWSSVSGQIKTAAAKAGCVDVDALLKLGDFNAVQVDDKFNVNSEDLERALEQSKAKFEYLWKKKGPSIADVPPSSRSGGEAATTGNGKLDLEKLSLKQKLELLAKTSAQR